MRSGPLRRALCRSAGPRAASPAPGIVVRDPRQRARWPWDRIQTGAESSGDPGHLVCILSVVYPQTIQARRINAFK
jgi:hypothetical protein